MQTRYFFNPEFATNATQEAQIAALFAEADLSHSPYYLGESVGRGVTYFLNTQALFGVNSVRRHYYRGGLFGKFVKDRYVYRGFERTRAYLEFQLLNQLYHWNLPVPRPIALRVEHDFCSYRADILLEKIDNCADLSQYLTQNTLPHAQYQQIGKRIRQLHDHQVHHSDLNIHNILFDLTSGIFWLIDFDKCAIRAGEAWKAENLARLKRSFEKERGRLKITFEEADWQALLEGYHACEP